MTASAFSSVPKCGRLCQVVFKKQPFFLRDRAHKAGFARIKAVVDIGQHQLIRIERVGVQRRLALGDPVQKFRVALAVVAKKGLAVFFERLGGLFFVVKGVVALTQIVFDDLDLSAQSDRGFAVLPFGQPEQLHQMPRVLTRLFGGGVFGRQPFGKQADLFPLAQRFDIRFELFPDNANGFVLALRVKQTKEVVKASEPGDMADIVLQCLRLVFGKPFQQHAEHPALAETAAHVARVEQYFERQLTVFGKGADKAADDPALAPTAHRTDRRKQIKAGGLCAFVRQSAVFGVGAVRFVLQFV